MSKNQKPIRKLAEIFTLSISTTLIILIFIYLGWKSLNAPSKKIAIKTEVMTQQVDELGNKFRLPVRLTNEGAVTLGLVKFKVRQAQFHEQEFESEYLGTGSERTVFIVLDRDPRTTQVEVSPVYIEAD